MGATARGVQVGAADRLAVEQRHVDFHEAFIDFIFAATILVVAGCPVATLCTVEQRVGRIIGAVGAEVGHARAIGVGVHAIEFAAIFGTEGDRQRSRPQFHRIAREVEAGDVLGQLGVLERTIVMRRDIGERGRRGGEAAEDVDRLAPERAGGRIGADDRAVQFDRIGRCGIAVLQHDILHPDVRDGDAMLIIGVIIPVGAGRAELALGAGDEAILLAIGIDLRIGEGGVGRTEAEGGDAGRGALVAHRLGQIGVGALDGQVGAAIAGAGLVVGLHLRDIDRDIGFVVVGEIIADPAIAIDALQRGFERGARAGCARQVAALAEAVAAIAVGDRAGTGRRAVRAIVELIGIAILVEGDALQRAIVDQAVAGILIGLGIIAVIILRQAIVGLAGVHQRGGAIPVAAAGQIGAEVAGAHAAFMVIFAADDDMKAIIHEGFAIGGLDQRGFVIAIFGDAAQDIALEAFEMGVGDEVDDAADRVRAVGGRRAAGDDVDALHQQLRKHGNVGHAGDIGADDALAVEQGQGADRAQAAQREGTEALLAAGGGEGAGGGAGRALERGQLGDGVEDVGLGVVGDLLLTDDGGGRRRIEAAGGDARSGDDDVGALCGRRIARLGLRRGFGRRFGLGLGGAGQRHDGDGGQADARHMPMDCDLHVHSSSPLVTKRPPGVGVAHGGLLCEP